MKETMKGIPIWWKRTFLVSTLLFLGAFSCLLMGHKEVATGVFLAEYGILLFALLKGDSLISQRKRGLGWLTIVLSVLLSPLKLCALSPLITLTFLMEKRTKRRKQVKCPINEGYRGPSAVLVAIVFVLGCCSVNESIPEEWSSYLVPITIDSKAGHYSEVSPSYITSICREYIDHCWEWNVELSRLRCNKPVVTCLVPDGVMVHSIDAGTRDSNKVPIPCGGIIEIRQSSIHDAIVKFCDNYGLRCSFGHCSVTIDIDRRKTCFGCAKMPEDFHVGSHGTDCQELVDDVISTKAK